MKTPATLFIPLLLLSGCAHDFFEEDLTGKSISILAPADHDTVSTTTPLFWWSEIRGARNYHLQIVYPDFSSPQQLVYDTLVDADRFYPALSPGRTYSWRIRAENASTKGDWVTRALTLDSTISLSAQSVAITFPAANNYATSTSNLTFSWNAISGATLYRIDVVNNANNSSVVNTTTTLNNFSYTFPEGNYTFNVRAENSSSITSWSIRTFSIDQTAPVAPVLAAPANNSFYATPPAALTFDWTSAADAVTDSLYISTDSTFVSGNQLRLLLNASQGNYTWTGAQAATYYFWRVRSADAAGNSSNYSSTFKFIVN